MVSTGDEVDVLFQPLSSRLPYRAGLPSKDFFSFTDAAFKFSAALQPDSQTRHFQNSDEKPFWALKHGGLQLFRYPSLPVCSFQHVVGVTLTQLGHDNEKHAIFYFSERLNTVEESYLSEDWNLLGFIYFLQRYHPYKERSPFALLTNKLFLCKLFFDTSFSLCEAWRLKFLRKFRNYIMTLLNRGTFLKVLGFNYYSHPPLSLPLWKGLSRGLRSLNHPVKL